MSQKKNVNFLAQLQHNAGEREFYRRIYRAKLTLHLLLNLEVFDAAFESSYPLMSRKILVIDLLQSLLSCGVRIVSSLH